MHYAKQVWIMWVTEQQPTLKSQAWSLRKKVSEPQQQKSEKRLLQIDVRVQAPANHDTPPEPRTPTAASKYFTTMAELKKSNESKPFTRENGSNIISTQVGVFVSYIIMACNGVTWARLNTRQILDD